MPSQNDGSSSGGGVIIVGINGFSIEIGPDDPLYADLKARLEVAAAPPDVPPSGTSTE